MTLPLEALASCLSPLPQLPAALGRPDGLYALTLGLYALKAFLPS